MTFAELQTDVRRRIGETVSTFYTDADIRTAINEAYADMADATEFYERQANVVLTDGVLYYNLSTILPDTFLSPRRAYNTERNTWLRPTDPRQLDYSSIRQWELTEGSGERIFLRGNWWMGVWPAPAASGNVIRLYYTSIPEAMADDDDTPAFPREFHVGLTECAAADLFGQQREVDKALKSWKSYEDYKGRLKSFVEKRASLAGSEVLG